MPFICILNLMNIIELNNKDTIIFSNSLKDIDLFCAIIPAITLLIKHKDSEFQVGVTYQHTTNIIFRFAKNK